MKLKAETNPPVAKAATEDSDSEYEGKRAVRAKVKPARGRAVRGKRGSLADMPSMPLDIIFEVSVFANRTPGVQFNLSTKTDRSWRT